MMVCRPGSDVITSNASRPPGVSVGNCAPSLTTRIVFVIRLHGQEYEPPVWNLTVRSYSPSGRLLTVTELGGVVGVSLAPASTNPTEFVPTKNSTGPASPLELAKASALKPKVAGAAKIVPLRGEMIWRSGHGAQPVQ